MHSKNIVHGDIKVKLIYIKCHENVVRERYLSKTIIVRSFCVGKEEIVLQIMESFPGIVSFGLLRMRMHIRRRLSTDCERPCGPWCTFIINSLDKLTVIVAKCG